MKGIFHPDKHYDWEYPHPSRQEMQELIKMDPVEDKYYLDYIIAHVLAGRRAYLMRGLGISKVPEKMYRDFGWFSDDYERYRVLCEQVAREPDAEVLKEAVYEAPGDMAIFAFCYLTKYHYPSPQNDSYSYLTYQCGWKEGMTTEDVVEFCREMIDVQGPFVQEARQILADPPKDHNDYSGKRMVSHEREVSEPPYVRKQRLAPFPKSAEYDQSRAEVLRLETRGLEALEAGDKENGLTFFEEMSRKSEQLGKYTQRWDALDDYARSLIYLAEAHDFDRKALNAATILRRLIKECPEEKIYREHLKKAEAVFRKAVADFAVENDYAEEKSEIVVYHYFDPKDAEMIRGLMEKWYRARGGKRQIEFRRQEEVCLEPPTFVDIYCCDLPILNELYSTEYIGPLPPFIDTENVLPALLEKSTFDGEVFALPVLVFAGPDSGTAVTEDGIVEPGTAVSAEGRAAVAEGGGAEGKATITESGGTEGGAEGRTTSYRAFVALMNLSRLRLKYLDRLDLMMLMTDSDFLIDVCRACNAGDETPHVFPASGTAFARLAEREPGYAAVFAQISEGSCVN